eukprot:170267-Amphidinium_carterae.4
MSRSTASSGSGSTTSYGSAHRERTTTNDVRRTTTDFDEREESSTTSTNSTSSTRRTTVQQLVQGVLPQQSPTETNDSTSQTSRTTEAQMVHDSERETCSWPNYLEKKLEIWQEKKGRSTIDMLLQGVAYYMKDKNYLEDLMYKYHNPDDKMTKDNKEMCNIFKNNGFNEQILWQRLIQLLGLVEDSEGWQEADEDKQKAIWANTLTHDRKYETNEREKDKEKEEHKERARQLRRQEKRRREVRADPSPIQDGEGELRIQQREAQA